MIEVKVLGTGCAKCSKLYEEVEKAAAASGAQVELSKVEKLDEILDYGVMMTPALVVNGEVKSTGNIPKQTLMIEWIKSALK